MDNLFFEIKSKIVNQLSAYDALKLRRLNKGWKSVVDQCFKIQNLSISYSQKYAYKWLGGKELVDCDFLNYDQFKIEQYRFLLIDQPYFSNLKFLLVKLYHYHEADGDIQLMDQINHLKTLESLELIDDRLAYSEGMHLLLPNLKSFRASVQSSDQPIFLTVESTNLTRLAFAGRDTMNRINIVHPSSVQYVESEYFTNKFTVFKNLKTLIISEFSFYGNEKIIADHFLIELPLLDEVHTHLKALSDVLSEQKKRLKRNDLRVFYKGVNSDLFQRLNSSDYKGRECRFCQSIYCPFSIINEGSLISQFSDDASNLSSILPFETELIYRHISVYLNVEEMSIDRSLLSSLMNKFINLKSIHVSEVHDATNLSVILDSCRSIICLEFRECSISQYWFDRLPDRCPRLQYLILYKNYIYDFNFLFQFNCLVWFDTNANLSDDHLDELENRRIMFKYHHHYVYYRYYVNDCYDYAPSIYEPDWYLDEFSDYQNDDSEYVFAKENRKYRIKKKFCSKNRNRPTNAKNSRPDKSKSKRKKRESCPIEMDLNLSLRFKD